MTHQSGEHRLRIGELSHRVGVSDHVLRAWERRYGLLRPVRTQGGFRLYSEADVSRVRRMQALLGEGLSAAEAAQAALREESTTAASTSADRAPAGGDVPDPGVTDLLAERLTRALEALDDAAAQEVLDEVLSRLTVEAAIRSVVLPCLKRLGAGWQAGEVSIAQEHFATQLLRGRLAALARGWGRGVGPTALLACPPGERHDVALLAFGLVLGRRGWSVRFLGADTPVESLHDVVAGDRPPDLVVLAATDAQRLDDVRTDLARLASAVRVCVAGQGATPELAAAVGATHLAGDPVSAAETLS